MYLQDQGAQHRAVAFQPWPRKKVFFIKTKVQWNMETKYHIISSNFISFPQYQQMISMDFPYPKLFFWWVGIWDGLNLINLCPADGYAQQSERPADPGIVSVILGPGLEELHGLPEHRQRMKVWNWENLWKSMKICNKIYNKYLLSTTVAKCKETKDFKIQLQT